MSFTSTVLTLEVRDHVATLWLDRPEQRNAMGRALFEDLSRAAEYIEADRNIRCVVIAATGPHFSVGLDLKEMGPGLGGGGASGSKAAQSQSMWRGLTMMQRANTVWAELRVPVIAALHGYVIGGAIDLVTACDIRIAASDAIFSVRETKMAIVADLGTLQRLPRIVGPGVAADWSFTSRNVDAAEAFQAGLVSRVVDGSADEVLGAARELALSIAANSPLAVEGTKTVLAYNDGHTVAEGLDFVGRWNAMYISSNDLTEALTAFLEKREPRFSGD